MCDCNTLDECLKCHKYYQLIVDEVKDDFSYVIVQCLTGQKYFEYKEEKHPDIK